jgi:hypothetical protein
MARLIFWYFVPWMAFFGLGAILYLGKHPGLLIPLGIIFLSFVVYVWIEGNRQADALLAKANELTRERQLEDRVRAARAAAVNQQPRAPTRAVDPPRGIPDLSFPQQYLSFAFRWGLPPDALRRKPPPISGND